MREVLVAQLRMAVESEPGHDERVEVPGEVVGQVEGAGLGVGQRRERRRAGEDLVAVRAGEPGARRAASTTGSSRPPVPQSA